MNNRALMNKKNKDKQSLEEHLLKLYQADEITEKVERQLQNLIENNHYTYEGILKTVIWIHEVALFPIYTDMTLGLVDKYYYDANKYFRQIDRAMNVNSKDEIQQYEVKQREIIITRPTLKKKEVILFDLEKDSD